MSEKEIEILNNRIRNLEEEIETLKARTKNLSEQLEIKRAVINTLESIIDKLISALKDNRD